MICKKCGKEIDDDSLFCESCGAKNGSEKKASSKSNKFFKIAGIIVIILIFSLASIISIIKSYNNTVLNQQLEISESNKDYFINSVETIDNNTLMIDSSDNTLWNHISLNQLTCTLMIFESGAVVDMDKNGKLNLAKGYSGYPGSEYSSSSITESIKQFGDSATGYYNLCTDYSSTNFFSKTEEFVFSDEYSFDENRIYNFHLEINNPMNDRLFNYDSYFRYSNGKFIKVKNEDLLPADAYFAWHNNELHFTRYSSMSENGYPCYQISDEAYDKRN